MVMNHDGEPAPKTDWSQKKYVRIVWARVGYPVRMVCWNRRIFGCSLHWAGKANLLCAGQDNGCPFCPKTTKRWYAWISGQCQHTGHQIVAQIPHESYVDAGALRADTLMGSVVKLERRDNARARVLVTVSRGRTFDPPDGWAEPDVGKLLSQRYEMFRSHATGEWKEGEKS